METIHSICVFCGSRAGKHPEYKQAALDFGKIIGKEGWRLVYGAGDIGLMGAVAQAAQAAHADTFGVIPEHLLDWEVGKRDLSRFIVTDDMHSRKKLMFVNSDAAVVLPGGAGSLDEFFEILTWAQLGLHKRPIILANIRGYWTPLITLVDHVIEQGFADASLKNLFQVCDTVDQVADVLRSFKSVEAE